MIQEGIRWFRIPGCVANCFSSMLISTGGGHGLIGVRDGFVVSWKVSLWATA
jgi:hypothetical protein